MIDPADRLDLDRFDHPLAGAFSRPRTNALAFRENDAVARAVLEVLSASGLAGSLYSGIRRAAGATLTTEES